MESITFTRMSDVSNRSVPTTVVELSTTVSVVSEVVLKVDNSLEDEECVLVGMMMLDNFNGWIIEIVTLKCKGCSRIPKLMMNWSSFK